MAKLSFQTHVMNDKSKTSIGRFTQETRSITQTCKVSPIKTPQNQPALKSKTLVPTFLEQNKSRS
ncbi:hypothetical protein Scep_002010 [Stephania cephalantha]|uniref:Uncharacterized protein n=1 Tax=Stephania cephalantha TaxID=152367 RepID=A0AAP0LD01_9MAGN